MRDLSGFSNVDHAALPDQYLRMLDAINVCPFFRDEQKPRSLERLNPQPGQHILDVGCGLGDVTRWLGRRVGSAGRVVGTDLSAQLIAEARRRTGPEDGPVEFAVGNAEELSWRDATFDASRVDRVLMFMKKPEQALREMVRVLRPTGRVVVCEFDMETVIVDSPYRLLTRKLLNFWCDTIPSGWIGRRLPGLCMELGLKAVTVTPLTMRLSKYEFWNDVFQIEATVQRAQQANVVSPAEAALWLEQQRDADARGRFFLALTLFMVAGEKPPRAA